MNIVTDIPGKPGVPEFVDWDVDRVVLKWTPPKNNGGAPITSYIIEAKEKFSASWNEMTNTDVSIANIYLYRFLIRSNIILIIPI